MLVYERKSLLHIIFLCGFLPTFLSCSTTKNANYDKDIQARKYDLSSVTKGKGPLLSEAINKNFSQGELTSERRKLLDFVNQKASDSAYEHCLKKFKSAPECMFIKPDWSESWFVEDLVDTEDQEDAALKLMEIKKTKKAPVRRSRFVGEVIKNIKNGVTTKSPRQQEGDYYRALKSFRQWEPVLESLAQKLISDNSCGEVELYNYLGLKAEEFFPREDLMKTAMKLYQKADQCAQDGSKAFQNRYVQNSRFRLGLLAVLKDDCSQAKQVFGRLSKMGVNDFSTRALYWSAYCSKASSQRHEFLVAFDQLFKMNPLGFHTMSMTRGDSLLVGNLNKPIDPIVKLRTSMDQQYNVWIQAIEDYDAQKDIKGVRKLLTPVRQRPEYLGALEPGVRLYLSTFAYRSKDNISLFRILDSVFRTQSEYVVDSTLKLFYPMKHLQSITEKVRRVNPFLITALIRQESAFQENARSRVGATGLMQLMPRTARLLDRKVTRSSLVTPETNLRIGIRYFESLVDRFEGDVELALAAYNAGPEAVDRWKIRYPVANRLLFLDLIPYSETRNYVTLIGRNYYWYSKLYAQDAKALASATGDRSIASSMNIPVEFRSLNSNAK